jgi:hypothetical protein
LHHFRYASIVAIFGEKTFPVATNNAGDTIIAAAEYGKVWLMDQSYWPTSLHTQNIFGSKISYF